ncbi:unnamed protein product [Lactuca virosa]|uniref:Uncharacterized protein n=1 Tax=Lactuca virosa TaxID=75947 RepID=A0AAU9PVK6_9ASTR|nr:unnamed protein product [Lactuca virosa]
MHSMIRHSMSPQSNIEETSNPDVTVNASNMNTRINSSKPNITSFPENIVVTPPESPISNSNMEEGRSTNIPTNLSNNDSNETSDEENSTSTIHTTTLPPTPPSSPPPTSTIIL